MSGQGRRRRRKPLTRPQRDLVEANLGLARAVSRRMVGLDEDYEELYAEACLALAEAARCFDPGRGVRFSTYAWNAMWRRIRLLRQRRLPRGYRRSRARAPGLVSLRADCVVFGAGRVAPPPWLSTEQRWVLERFERLLARLGPRDAAIIRERARGFGYAEIGTRFHLSPQRVHQILDGVESFVRRQLCESAAASAL